MALLLYVAPGSGALEKIDRSGLKKGRSSQFAVAVLLPARRRPAVKAIQIELNSDAATR
jgi:hypothetical protein